MIIIPTDGKIPGAGNGDNRIAVAVQLIGGAFLLSKIDDFFNIQFILSPDTGRQKQQYGQKQRGYFSEHLIILQVIQEREATKSAIRSRATLILSTAVA